jgi:hypothetical protein
MNHITAPSRSSWLSLVAETAGVSGAVVARVQLQSRRNRVFSRAVVQILDATDHILGACYWYGDGADLCAGTSVDIGYDLDSAGGLRVRAWLDDSTIMLPARLAEPTEDALCVSYDPAITPKLIFGNPTHAADELEAA